MRKKLEELNPEWVDDGGTERAAFAFDCGVHSPPHRLTVWLRKPGGGGVPVTETGSRILHDHEGDLFDELSLFTVVHHGEVWLFLANGEVVAG